MSKNKLIYKIIPIFLIASILFTSCDIPDISEFTTQSTEMTRGIRQGVKETGDVLKTAAANKDLFEQETINEFQKHSKEYDVVMKPTLATLDALDSYVEALNALSQANKKSAENSKALVGAFDNLVTSAASLVIAPPAAAFEIPEMALKIGTGVLAIAENFRTAQSFKKRVNAAAEIVEGRYDEKEELVGGKKVIMYKKVCTDDKKADIEKAGKDFANKLKTAITNVEKDPKYKELNEETAKKEFLKKVLEKERVAAQADVDAKLKLAGCGIIDLITFTMQDLRRINQDVSRLTVNQFQAKNKTTVNLYQGIDLYHSNVQQEVSFILDYKTYLSSIKQLNFRLQEAESNNQQTVAEDIKRRILNLKANARLKLDSIYVYDSQVQVALRSEIAKCEKNNCAGMTEYLTCTECQKEENEEAFDTFINSIPPTNFDHGSGVIETVLNARAVQLLGENRDYLTERERIKPDYIRVNAELETMRQSQKKLDKLMTTSIAALKTWSATHANLRETVNTKKPLSISVLVAKVKDIWAVLEPQETE